MNVPQLDADIDRVKAKQQGVPLQNLFETMQIYLGSLYVNDFNRFGRTYQVIAQADAQFRDRAEDITRLKTRNAKGQMVPLGTLVKVTETHGPDRAMRYNGYPAAEINGGPAPGFSSGQAEALIAKLANENLPKGAAFEWTELTYQRILAGNTAVYVYPLCILLVFLVLAAQYESFRLPLAIILIVPMCLLFAITGVWLKGSDNNIFTQIGLIVLVGLACKNAILIVEFAKHKQDEGKSPVEAAIEASRLRLRPILMTSIAFIAGVFPLVKSHGAGAEMRQAMGVAVFAGMIGVTLFGLFLTPVFYVTLMKLGWKKKPAPGPELKGTALGSAGATAGVAAAALLFTVVSAKAGLLSVGPDYRPPTNSVPAYYKAVELGAWKEGRPLDNVPKGNWWEIFGDAGLNEQEAQAVRANQELKAAVARRNASRPEDGDAHRPGLLAGPGAGPHLDDGFLRRGPAHRLIAEPGGDIFGGRQPPLLNQLAFCHRPFPVLRQKPERLQGCVLPQQAASDYGQIAHRDGSARGHTGFFYAENLAAVNLKKGSRGFFGSARFKSQARNRSDRGQRLSAEPQGCHRE